MKKGNEQRRLKVTILFNDDEEENMERYCRAVKTILSNDETNEQTN